MDDGFAFVGPDSLMFVRLVLTNRGSCPVHNSKLSRPRSRSYKRMGVSFSQPAKVKTKWFQDFESQLPSLEGKTTDRHHGGARRGADSPWPRRPSRRTRSTSSC
jgi:hypothetical protein